MGGLFELNITKTDIVEVLKRVFTVLGLISFLHPVSYVSAPTVLWLVHSLIVVIAVLSFVLLFD